MGIKLESWTDSFFYLGPHKQLTRKRIPFTNLTETSIEFLKPSSASPSLSVVLYVFADWSHGATSKVSVRNFPQGFRYLLLFGHYDSFRALQKIKSMSTSRINGIVSTSNLHRKRTIQVSVEVQLALTMVTL